MKKGNAYMRCDLPATTSTSDSGTGAANAGVKVAKAAKRAKYLESIVGLEGD